jgi:hypothetical protein
MLRRSFLKLTGWAAGVGVLAHHKPGHKGGPPTPAPPAMGDTYHDSYRES